MSRRTEKILKLVNQPISLLLLGTIVVGTAGSFLSERRECVAHARLVTSQFRMVVNEIGFRTTHMHGELLDLRRGANGESDPTTSQPLLQRLAQLRSHEGPALNREFRGENYAALFYRMRSLGRDIEIQYAEPSRDLTRNDLSDDHYYPLPFFLEIRVPGDGPMTARRMEQTDVLMSAYSRSPQLALAGFDETGNAFDRIAQWMRVMLRGALRTRDGCGLRAVAKSLLGWETRNVPAEHLYWN